MITTVQCSICSIGLGGLCSKIYYYAMLLLLPIAVIITPKIIDYALGICNYTSKASLITSTVTHAHAR